MTDDLHHARKQARGFCEVIRGLPAGALDTPPNRNPHLGDVIDRVARGLGGRQLSQPQAFNILRVMKHELEATEAELDFARAAILDGTSNFQRQELAKLATKVNHSRKENRMRRTNRLLAATAIAALEAVAPAAMAASGTPTLKLSKTKLGKILTSKGDTLYMFTRDKPNHDTCVRIKHCASVWPPLLTSGKPKAGPGVSASLIGTIKLSGDRRQVTYNKHPLYLFPSEPKGTAYVGERQFGGYWDAVNKAGKAVK